MTSDSEIPRHVFARPAVDDSAFVAPSAWIIGDVHIGVRASIWFGCVLRGDVQQIRIGARTNIQDATIIHGSTGGPPTVIGDDVTVGHRAVLHGCTIEDRAFVGIGAIVLDRAVVRNQGVLAAGAVLTPGKVVNANELWIGNPARFVRMLTDDDNEFIHRNAQRYVTLAGHYHHNSVPTL